MKIAELLMGLGLCSADNITLFHKGTRDRSDINVLRCEKSGLIFLESDDHITPTHYAQMDGFSYWGKASREAALAETCVDDERRADTIRRVITGKKWLDVGTGAGGILDLLRGQAAETAAVEPQTVSRNMLQQAGHRVFSNIESVPKGHFDVITLFHVLEHIPQPVEFLKAVRECLAPKGRVCIEVPHARDALITLYDCKPFIRFTLWSEHLILHTRESLRRVAAESRFGTCEVSTVQRYSLPNHLYWLAKGAPGGHKIWAERSTPEMNAAYDAKLASLDNSDTLLAWLTV